MNVCNAHRLRRESNTHTHSPQNRKPRNYIKIVHTIIHVHIAYTNYKLHRQCTREEFSSFYFFLSRNIIFRFEKYQSF